jgi:hypothetical protein
MHITGISGFSAMYMKLFIQSTLVKTQMLNIRIYSDRKTLYSNVYLNNRVKICCMMSKLCV